jgi:hypothetical protein
VTISRHPGADLAGGWWDPTDSRPGEHPPPKPHPAGVNQIWAGSALALLSGRAEPASAVSLPSVRLNPLTFGVPLLSG